MMSEENIRDYLRISKPDKLDSMLMKQFQLQLRFKEPIAEPYNKTYVNRMVAFMHSEIEELHDTIGWQDHRTDQKVDIEAYNDEAIDLLNYAINLNLITGATPEQIYERHDRKNKINNERLDNGRNKPRGEV